MEMLSRRKFVKCLGAMGLLVAAGSLVGCDDSGGESQNGSSQQDVNGLLVESAKLTLSSSSTYKYITGYFTIKNITDSDFNIDRHNFSVYFGENFNLMKENADDVSYRIKENYYARINSDGYILKAGESQTFSVDFVINNTQYEILLMNCNIQMKFKNGNKEQSFTMKNNTLTIGNVRNS